MPKYPQVKSPATCELPSQLRLSAYCKQAHEPNQLADIAALKAMLGLGVGAFGAGALLRSAKEVPAVFAGQPSFSTTGAPMPTEVPVPMDPAEAERRKLLGVNAPPVPGPLKVADFKSDPFGHVAGMAYDNVLKPVMEAVDPVKATNPWAKWWAAPAMIGTGLAAGGAGWKLVDWMADKRRDIAGDADLQRAKQEYEDAVRGLHAKTAGLDAARQRIQKEAHPDGISPRLADHLAQPGNAQKLLDNVGQAAKNVGQMGVDAVTGAASSGAKAVSDYFTSGASPAGGPPQMDNLAAYPWARNAMKNYGGLGLGALALAATAGFVPTAYYAYHHTRNNSDTKALQEALMARRRAQQLRNPAPPHLVLAPPAA